MDKSSKAVSKNVNKVNFKSDSDTVRKEIVRNPKVPLSKTLVKTVNLGLGVIDTDQISSLEGNEPQSNQSAKTTGNSKLTISKKIGPTEKSQEEVKKVNIPFSEKKYRGLVDLGSLEAVLAERSAESRSRGTNKRRACLPNKDPEPVLSDYYTPKFDTEYVFSFPPAPCKITKEWSYNPRSIINVLEQIESDDSSSYDS